MAGKPKFTAEQVEQAIRQSQGLQCLAAQALKCSVGTIRNYRKEYPAVEEAFSESKDLMLDAAEGALYRAVMAGEAWAICFFLKTQGKRRGYIEKHVIGHEGAIRIEVGESLVTTRDEARKVLPLPETGPVPGLNGNI